MTPGQLHYVQGLEEKVNALGEQVEFLLENNARMVNAYRTAVVGTNDIAFHTTHLLRRTEGFRAFGAAVLSGGKSMTPYD